MYRNKTSVEAASKFSGDVIMCFTVNLLSVCIAVASFAVLVQLAVAQGANTTLPLTYPGQVLQGDVSQTCPSEGQLEMVRNEVDNATQRLLRESVVPALQATIFCGGSGWRRENVLMVLPLHAKSMNHFS